MPTTPPRLAIVTGAAGGLGRAFCRRIAQVAPCHIVAIDRDEPGAHEALRGLQRDAPQGGALTAEVVAMDVTDATAWLELRRRLQQERPRLDLLVNNAGICLAAEVGDGDLAAWRRVNEVNYVGVLAACHIMTPWLKASARAPSASGAASPSRQTSHGADSAPAVINVASIAAFLAAPSMGAYAAAKAAVVALTEAMHAELRPAGVHVTAVCPGFFRTGLLAAGEFCTRRHRAQAEKLARGAKFTADDVVQAALAASAQGRLYSMIGGRARWGWRAKRLAPGALVRMIERSYWGTFRGHGKGGEDAASARADA
ncbi:MAG TPA: SDR family NAD(P)-dependent oxidoreductase [Lacipirellulaceae bacterium]|nr:SDR family NAD(P)-dependent oxidoreductase [Lacipirellulaceae bacterium]